MVVQEGGVKLAEEANKWNRENGEPERKIPKKYR